jgi:hypothetical protein
LTYASHLGQAGLEFVIINLNLYRLGRNKGVVSRRQAGTLEFYTIDPQVFPNKFVTAQDPGNTCGRNSGAYGAAPKVPEFRPQVSFGLNSLINYFFTPKT